MKKAILLVLMITVIAIPTWAIFGPLSDVVNEFDSITPVGYSASPVSKTTVAISTYKNMDDSNSNYFKNNMIFAYIPFGMADLRLQGRFWNSGGQDIQIGSLINLGLCGLHVAYMTYQYTSGPSESYIIAEALFDNTIFVWGLGVTRYLGSGDDSLPFIKIGKEIGLGAVSLDGRLITEFYPSGANPKSEASLKVKTPAFPVYGGIRILNVGSQTNTVVDLGVMVNL